MSVLPPLLALASGRKVRTRKASISSLLEIVVHIAVAQLLREHCLPDWKWTHVPSGEHRDIRTAAKLKAMGVRRGWPDFILISPYGTVRFLELKRAGGTLSEEQNEFRLHCVKHGIPHAVAHSLDQALATLDKWQCLRIKVAGALPKEPAKCGALP